MCAPDGFALPAQCAAARYANACSLTAFACISDTINIPLKIEITDKQRDDLVIAQMKERCELQDKIRLTRERESKQILALSKDAAHYRLMQAGELPEMLESIECGSGRERGSERESSRGRDGNTGRGRDKDLG